MKNVEAAEIIEKAIRCMKSDRRACPEHCNECVHNVPAQKGLEALTIAIKALKEKEE